MRALWYFLHMFGQIAWLGGALAAMVIGMAVRREASDVLGPSVRLQGAIYRQLIGPGALIVVLSGILLTLQMYNRVTAVGLNHWLMAMQGLGILGGLMVLVHTVPTSNKLMRLEPTGSTAAAFHGIHRRLKISGMISSMIGMLGLLTSALYQMG
ncbi:MAG TPA: hypothetical protein VFO95_18210 [Gemmatimonadales bacterium]|nr:hypothetical protein [Gemmatimonadales bacterium]